MKTVALRLSVAIVTFVAGTLANFALRPTPVVNNVTPHAQRVELRAVEQPWCAEMSKIYLDNYLSAYDRTHQADSLVDHECYGEAVTLLEDAVRRDPSYAYAYGDLAYLYNTLSRFEEATAVLEKGLRLEPDNVFMNIELAYAHNAIDNPSAAIVPLSRVMRLEHDNAYAVAALSDSYLQLDERERALAFAREAVKLGARSGDKPALDNAAMLLLDMGYPEEAETSVLQAAEIKPESVYVNYTLGTIQAARGLSEEAAESFRRAVAAHPEFPYEHLMRAWARLYLGDACAAACEARQYLNLVEWKGHNVAHAGVLAYLALRRAGRDEEALGVLEEAAAHTDPSSFEAQLMNCMRGRLSEEKLFAKAAHTDELTVAHAYVGLKQALDADSIDERHHASANLEWVRTRGSKQLTAYAYTLEAQTRVLVIY
jgi:tetratricopeptide (TPR) repeat protein